MTKIETFIEAAKDALRQISGFGSLYDVKEKLRAAISAVESAKPGNRLELVEISEEEAKSLAYIGSGDFVVGESFSTSFYEVRYSSGWRPYGDPTGPLLRFTKFYRLAHPAEMEQSEPMVPLKDALAACSMYQAGWREIFIDWTKRGYLQWVDGGETHWKCATLDSYVVAKEYFPQLDCAISDQLAAKGQHAGKVKIADGWVERGSDTLVYFVSRSLEVDVKEVTAAWCHFQDCGYNERTFLSESAAQSFSRSERLKVGWRETADGGWVKPGGKCWLVQGNGIYYVSLALDYNSGELFLDPAKAAEFLKAKGGGK